jgi:hypothetical protein
VLGRPHAGPVGRPCEAIRRGRWADRRGPAQRSGRPAARPAVRNPQRAGYLPATEAAALAMGQPNPGHPGRPSGVASAAAQQGRRSTGTRERCIREYGGLPLIRRTRSPVRKGERGDTPWQERELAGRLAPKRRRAGRSSTPPVNPRLGMLDRLGLASHVSYFTIGRGDAEPVGGSLSRRERPGRWWHSAGVRRGQVGLSR